MRLNRLKNYEDRGAAKVDNTLRDHHNYSDDTMAELNSMIVLLFIQNNSWFKNNQNMGRDPSNQNSNRSEREKWTTSKGGPVFSKLFRLDRTDPLSFGTKFPEILVEWITLMLTSIDSSSSSVVHVNRQV